MGNRKTWLFRLLIFLLVSLFSVMCRYGYIRYKDQVSEPKNNGVIYLYTSEDDCSRNAPKEIIYQCGLQKMLVDESQDKNFISYPSLKICGNDYGYGNCHQMDSGEWAPNMGGYALIIIDEKVHSFPVYYSLPNNGYFMASGYKLEKGKNKFPRITIDAIPALKRTHYLSEKICFQGEETCKTRIEIGVKGTVIEKLSLLNDVEDKQ